MIPQQLCGIQSHYLYALVNYTFHSIKLIIQVYFIIISYYITYTPSKIK